MPVKLPDKATWRKYRDKNGLPKAPKPKCVVVDFYRKRHKGWP